MTDLTLFKELTQQWETQSNNVSSEVAQKIFRLAAFQLYETIIECKKAHTEQNRPLSIDLGELAPEILKLQCGFGDENE